MTLLMHHHIYKNAGTTIDWILHRNFPGGVLHIEGDAPGARLSPAQIISTAKPFSHAQAITSHTCPLPGREHTWAKVHLTLLRDPLDRFYSIYRFDRQRADNERSSRAAREYGFRDYCEWWLDKPNMMNWQTRACTPQTFLPDRNGVDDRIGWDADLHAARSLLVSPSVFVGVVEDFDASMLLLEELLRNKGVSFDAAYLRKNITPRDAAAETKEGESFLETFRASLLARLKKNSRKSGLEAQKRKNLVKSLGASLFARFEEENAMDIELHELARSMIDKRFAEFGGSRRRLGEFRARCQTLVGSPSAKKIRVPPRDKWLRVARKNE